jgi:DNA-binding NarL/FixJ family response regulator
LPTRFFLSSTACAGILRRAAKRGRVLPEALARALEDQALRSNSIPSLQGIDLSTLSTKERETVLDLLADLDKEPEELEAMEGEATELF